MRCILGHYFSIFIKRFSSWELLAGAHTDILVFIPLLGTFGPCSVVKTWPTHAHTHTHTSQHHHLQECQVYQRPNSAPLCTHLILCFPALSFHFSSLFHLLSLVFSFPLLACSLSLNIAALKHPSPKHTAWQKSFIQSACVRARERESPNQGCDCHLLCNDKRLRKTLIKKEGEKQ